MDLLYVRHGKKMFDTSVGSIYSVGYSNYYYIKLCTIFKNKTQAFKGIL